jgi:hypothetical protein
MEETELLGLVRGYEERISRLEQQVLVLETAMHDVRKLGVPHYGIHCKRVLEQAQAILDEAVRKLEHLKSQAQGPKEGKTT